MHLTSKLDDTDSLQEQDTEVTPVQAEHAFTGYDSAGIKRESEDSGPTTGGRKRSKPEKIVLDD